MSSNGIRSVARMAWRRRFKCTPLALFTLMELGTGCVPQDAGYSDVRRISTERLGHSVRWDEHDSRSASEQETQKLLARPLNADSAVRIALLNDQGLQAAFQELGVARAGLVHALRLPNPTAEAALRFSGAGRGSQLELRALEDVSELILLPWRASVATAQLDAAKASVAGQVLDVAFAARTAFYEYQAAAQGYELSETVLRAVQASFDAAQRLHDAGNITDLDFENERALYEESRIAFTRAEAALEAKRQALNGSLGLWGTTAAWKAEPRLPDPESTDEAAGDIERRALERSLDLELIRQRVVAAARRANLARADGWIPKLEAGVAAQREDKDWGVGPAVALELPLFYQGQGQTDAALAELVRQRKRFSETAVHIRAAARATGSSLRATAESATFYKTVVLPLRERIMNDTQLEYNAMGVGVFQLLQAKRDQIRAAQTYVELLRDYWVLRAQSDELLAGRLPRGMLSSEEQVREATPLERGRGGLEQH